MFGNSPTARPRIPEFQRQVHYEITATASASANTKGSYAQVVASLDFDCAGFYITFSSGQGQARDYLVDIAVGGAGSEQVIVSNFYMSSKTVPMCMYFPIPIPAGTRVAVRSQASSLSGACDTRYDFVAGSPVQALGLCTTYGDDVTTSHATPVVDCGSSAGSKGAYVEVTSATTYDIRWLIICISNQNDASRQNAGFNLDIAVGASSSEVVILADLFLISDSTINMMLPMAYAFPVRIPAGTRIAARAKSSTTDATDRKFGVIIYGVS